LIAGGAEAPVAPTVMLVDKPPGERYETYRAELVAAARDTPCWMRQMTLGPGPEFIVVAEEMRPALRWPFLELGARVVVR
jgi:hypothetical protein